ncbi:AT-rich interactive domain-containing protein 1 [Forsythia ovata]|uniref:AT-rich interactive domain-containing protein 1 n=1 Tax=Forsythia ovata TaxID=205694 RepID=A0ABD1VGH1_9LAMI
MNLESDSKALRPRVSYKNKKTEEFRKATRKLLNGDDNRGLVELDVDVKNAYENKCFQNVGEEISEVVGGNGDDVEMNSGVVNKDPTSTKRKRGCYLRMLKWINEVAKDPCDPVIGSLPERYKWKYYGCEELWKQVLLVREAMLWERMVDSSGQQTNWQKKQNMHPNMYYGQSGSERLRCSERLLSAKDSSKKARIGSESLSSDSQSEEYPADIQSDSTAYSVALWGNYQCRKRIPLGPLFQADLPEFTGKTNESDSTWLGTRIWPLEKCEHKGVLIERDRIGKGRQDSCGCQFPGSVQCVKFHVAEKSARVKLELCSAFYGWKFDSIGEEVALCWTKEEQNRFQDIVKSNPLSQDKCFWDELYKLFSRKDREALVSYYYNVFLLRRRGYQNRTATSNIDSDDEESEFGLLAAKSPGSIFCSPRKSHLNIR